MNELCVNLNWEILGSESEDGGITSTKILLEYNILHQRNDDLNIMLFLFTKDWHSNFDHTPVMVNFEQER